ncbi:MAG: DUF2269 family protein [Thermoleophilia bacterium]
MPTLYESLVFVHVLMAIIWVGGAVALQVLYVRAQRSTEPGAMTRTAGDAEFIGMRVFMPASIILLLSGIWAVIEGPWEFEQAWISAGFAVWFFSLVVGMGFLGPESGRIKNLMAERGPDDAQVKKRLARIFLVSRVELVALIAIVFIMSVKPWL